MQRQDILIGAEGLQTSNYSLTGIQCLLLDQLLRFREVTIIQPTWFMPREVFNAVGYEGQQCKRLILSGYLPDTDQPEDMLFFYKHLSLGGDLFKVHNDLLFYR